MWFQRWISRKYFSISFSEDFSWLWMLKAKKFQISKFLIHWNDTCTYMLDTLFGIYLNKTSRFTQRRLFVKNIHSTRCLTQYINLNKFLIQKTVYFSVPFAEMHPVQTDWKFAPPLGVAEGWIEGLLVPHSAPLALPLAPQRTDWP